MLYVQCTGIIWISQHINSFNKRNYEYVRCSGFDRSFVVEVLSGVVEPMVEALYI